MTEKKLSVCVVAYNHAPYIAQALDGFLMQKTDFPFQVIVGDDASTDGTTEIIRRYAEQHPDVIKPIFHPQNIGAFDNSMSVYRAAQTPYVALCDGDDYWTDPDKLQMQIDFLDSHPDFALCFHPVAVRHEDEDLPDSRIPPDGFLFPKKGMGLEDLLESNFMQTNSVVYRWRFNQDPLSLIPHGIAPGDWFIHLLHAETGKIGFIDRTMAVYRRHATGIWTGAGVSDEWFCRYGIPHIKFFEAVEHQFGRSYFREKQELVNSIFRAAENLKNEAVREELRARDEDAYGRAAAFFGVRPRLRYFRSSLLSKITTGRLQQHYKKEKRLLRRYLQETEKD